MPCGQSGQSLQSLYKDVVVSAAETARLSAEENRSILITCKLRNEMLTLKGRGSANAL